MPGVPSDRLRARRALAAFALALLLPLTSSDLSSQVPVDGSRAAPTRLALPARDLAADPALPELLLAERQVELVDVVALQLPDALPESFVVSVPTADGRRTLSLTRHSLRGPGTGLLVWDGSDYVSRTLPDVTTYRGTLLEDPTATVLASLRPRGLAAQVFPSGGRDPWNVEPLSDLVGGALRADHAVATPNHDHPPLACGADELPAPLGLTLGPNLISSARTATKHLPRACMERAQLAFDADFEFYQAHGSDVDAVVSRLEGLMNQVEFFYARDVAITYRLTQFVVRTAPFYFPTGGGNLLDLFRAEWEGPLSAIKRDIGHLMTGKPGSLIEYGGLAWVGAVCTSIQYGWSMDSAGIIGHEIGHNWNAPHCLDPTPCNTMCGACLSIGPVTREVMLDHKASRDCLTLVPFYDTPLPPWLVPEAVTVRKDDVTGGASVAFDVLAQSFDGNCERVLVGDFDATSERGGSVSLVPAGSDSGDDQLVYMPPAVPFLGAEHFDYTLRDVGGNETLATATLTVRPNDLAGYWRLDELAGGVADDATSYRRDGTLSGGPLWAAGLHDGALEFDGVDDQVAIPAPNLSTDEVTITAWMRRRGVQNLLAGIVWCRDGTTTANLGFTSFDRLAYQWDDVGFSSSLVPPNDVWTFVALTVQSTGGTIWMHNGTSLLSATNAVAHDVEPFDGQVLLGKDPISGSSWFDGWLDDVRLYDHALDAAQLQAIVDNGGGADAPYPLDGGAGWNTAPTLTWAPGLATSSYDVYVGSDYAAVRDATLASPEYQGTQVDAEYFPGALTAGDELFWRVDETSGPDMLTGQVWQFIPPEFHHFALDETSGLVAADSEGGLVGTIVNGALLGEPGASPSTGTSFYLDGVNDGVRFPAANLASNTVTMTAWVRRDGDQNAWSGLIFSRAGSTVAGLNFGEGQELRYHWDSGQWGWNSGIVVPDDTWVFTALVIEPDRATIYLGDGGVLTSATNLATHAPEAFNGLTWIGRDTHSSPRRFRGWVDDVRLYNAALSPADIAQLYAARQ